METESFPVVIIGTGPSGATTALLLGRLGIKSLCVSRHRGTANTPRAHIFNQRAMEVLRDAGLERRLREVASPARDMQHTSWLHSLVGEEYGRLWAWGNGPERKGDYEAASPCEMSDLPQSILEPILVDEAREHGTTIRFQTEFVSQADGPDGVTTTLRDRSTGRTYSVQSQYLIGADGARSAVLDSLGIAVDGRQLNTAFNVHIRCELGKYLEHRPGSLNWILNPEAPDWSAVGNIRMVRPWNEFVVSMHPARKDGATFEPTKEEILSRLRQMIGDPDVSIEILSAFRWTINDQVARSWTKGRVICIGDATHRHPPINGLGSNTCISDAMNISWKLGYLLQGKAGPRILGSITQERKPVGDAIVKRANAGMEDHRHLWSVLGLTSGERKEKTGIMGEASAQGKALRIAVQQALEKTDDEVNALGIQMNQVYRDSCCVVVDPGDVPPVMPPNFNWTKELSISTFPGHHLPHVWLAKDSLSHRVSILDLCGNGKFTLFTGVGGECWRQRAEDIARSNLKIELQVVSIGWRQDYMDAYRTWNKIKGVEDEGAVLVRPDHFVGWRCKTIPKDSRRLKAVLCQILDIDQFT